MSAPESVLELIERFERNIEDYRSPNYNEARLRLEFIDPFFEALGWDVQNKQGNAEAYKDVITEDSLLVEASPKAPDYCFRFGGQRKFFVEAKKPAVNIKEDSSPAFQLRRYAWSAKLPLSILTDFEEFAVYDTRIKPEKDDKASTARVEFIKYTEYAERWDEIADIFSPDAIRKGSFDRFVVSTKKKRGTAEVDDAFLEEIESWRDMLARNIALRNPGLSQRELNFAVQATIDRIIFLRICEGRGIEEYGTLMTLQNGVGVYPRLMELFKKADFRYNSGLFHFDRERGRPDPDTITPKLTVDDKVLKDILKRLYYPESPYEFSMIPPDILGQVYERFLGKVIRLTPGGQAKVEDKPEVRKAGGVYYTPTYIVDYIVKHTVGKLLDGKNPKKADKIRILDPACGSGSFLLGAYQYLLDWYLDAHAKNDPESLSKKRKPPIYRNSHGEWRLSPTERKRILLDHIYGVDIDSQAVEVTKLSLVLKVLEGENEEILNNALRLFHERALPDLDGNIKCGNSLIGPDFYDNHQTTLFTEENHYRVNVFDWRKQFPQVFKCDATGFDAVIGNPPYVRIQAMTEWVPYEVQFYKKHYRAGSKGNFDIYVLFIERGLQLLGTEGRLGFILPNKFFNAEYGEPIRSIISQGKHLLHIVHFGCQQIFDGSTTYTCLLFLGKQQSKSFHFVKVDDLMNWREKGEAAKGMIQATRASASEWCFNVGTEAKLLGKLGKDATKLGELAKIFVGLQTSADEVFIMEYRKEHRSGILLFSKALGREVTLERALLHPLISGTDVIRYGDLRGRQYILFPYLVRGEKAELMGFKTISDKFPRTAAYLMENRKRLEKRERGLFKGHDWYKFGRNQNLGIQNRVKLCVPRLVSSLGATYDRNGEFFLDNVDVGGVVYKDTNERSDILYLLALINSKLLRWFFPSVSAPFRGGWMSANKQYLSKIPIRLIDFSNPSDRKRHDRMVDLVDHMLDLHKKLPTVKTPHEKDSLQRQIDATDSQIDRLVYELYELTDEEIKIVEGENK